jgi:GDP/UDP-N,N'-diacetylbacillosamine 2-epimerase (hydrolysing)
MKKICILTATRAEYGLLRPIILKLVKNPNFDIRVAVTGAHLSPEFGLTYKEIEQDGISIDEKVEILLSADTPTAVSKSMGLAMIGFAEYFSRSKPDLLMVLGDRYETLAVCCAAMNQRIPIAHLYGGETTEGAVDESIRHAITKLSYLHFTSTEPYRRRVIQLGEHPDRVFCVGAIGVENILHEKLLTLNELGQSIDFTLDKPYAVITFHPVTLENSNSAGQFRALLSALQLHPEMKFIFSKANADVDGRIINQIIDEYVQANQNAVAFTSLGMKRYLSALKYCSFVIGNSSSGLIEAPSFGVPTINIGDRQKGRLQADSVINCQPDADDIARAIELALSAEGQQKARQTQNPYGDGNTSAKIIEVLEQVLLADQINLKKWFFDCEV